MSDFIRGRGMPSAKNFGDTSYDVIPLGCVFGVITMIFEWNSVIQFANRA